ncbi:hypothetical protein LO772_15570 [Yinghuangia sp. ASG 101]|uniref:hypothetical protein n=1 Tax=Yinghuangia sp. ASG 101 TaxID=2896848 RepID=UPI001E5D91B5|nr:hypothetical protein [Yinghuangia sp. ASG 101]UGQ14862.1 hypothetical protein LO772_15570 [Yinghuangia sp. ASG 101]
MTHATLLAQLADQRGLGRFPAFARAYSAAAQDLAERCNDARLTHEVVSERSWRRWRTGATQNTNDVAARILTHMFGRNVPELLGQPVEEAALAPSLIDESELLMTAHEASEQAGALAGRRVAGAQLDQLQDDIRELARRYSSTPPVTVYAEGKRLHAISTSLLDRTAAPAQRRDLHLANGTVCALLSHVAFDLGSRAASAELARAARMHAEIIDHHPLMTYADCTLALIAYWQGRPSAAVALVENAERFTVGGAGTIRRASIAARAYAHAGDHERAELALRTAAETSRDRRDELHDEIGGELSFPDARRAMSAGTTLLLLGETQRAGVASGEALDAVMSCSPGSRSMKLLGEAAADQAHARLLSGDLDGAESSLRVVFDIPPECRVDGMVHRLHPVRAALSAAPYRAARGSEELRDRIEAFALTGAPTLLSAPDRAALS